MAAEKFHMLFLFWALIKGMSEAKADVGVLVLTHSLYDLE